MSRRGLFVILPIFLRSFFDAPARVAVAVLWFTGATLATTAAILAATRPGAGPYGAFVVAAVGLIVLGGGLLAVNVWAMAVSFVLLAGQLAGVIGTMWQLVFGIDAGKAAELRALGFEPAIGVAINLAFSLLATCVFALALFRRAHHARDDLS